MAWYYADTSAIVKRYARELGTAWMTNLIDPVQGHVVWTVRLAGPELIAALFRKVRTGEIAHADAVRAATRFRSEWPRRYRIVEVTTALTEDAMRLAEHHALRGYDAVHVAAAVDVDQVQRWSGVSVLTFLSADVHQLRVAAREGFTADNPNNHP